MRICVVRLLVSAALAFCLSALLCLPPGSLAQTPGLRSATPDLAGPALIPGHLVPWARPANDLGPAPAALTRHLTFVLTRPADRQAAFTQLLADQQNPASPRFHQWLTPAQVGELYGPAQQDIDALTAWLTSRGLTAPQVSPSRMFVQLDATAAAISSALSSPLHAFAVSGGTRIAPTAEPAIPAAFSALVQFVAGLSDEPAQPAVHARAVTPATLRPDGTYSSNTHFLTPGDFNAIYDAGEASFTGIGQRIAVIGRSRVALSDITSFESSTHIPQNLPTVILAGPDPGLTGDGDQVEATIDVSRAQSVATGAAVDLVIESASSGGTFSAAQYAVNTVNDPVLNISFSQCETVAGAASTLAWDNLFSQAAAQGISVTVAAGDSGAAQCDVNSTSIPATQTASINYLCASSHVTCVGGTEFADTANPSLYWFQGGTPSSATALSYIPEGAWNEPSSTTSGTTTYTALAGGGGASRFIAKPAWQTGTGVPSDGARDVPDVSFSASAHDAFYGCYAGNGGDCSAGYFETFAGTSASAPSMAGIAAILDQRTGQRQGNLNPTLYTLAANPANAVFHDSTVASSAVSGCTVSIPSMCDNSTPSAYSLTGGQPGFVLTPGYDQATGWGSLDVGKLLTASGPAQTFTYAFLSGQTSVLLNAPDIFTFTLNSASTSQNPTGSVQFFVNGVLFGAPVPLATGGGATTLAIPFTTEAYFTVSATYSGDRTFAPSSASTYVYVHRAYSSMALTPAISYITSLDPLSLSVTVTGSSGTPTGTVALSLSGQTGVQTLPSLTLVNGAASSVSRTFAPGFYFITATYSGDNTYGTATAVGQINVAGVPTTSTLTASSSTATPQQSITFSASVTGAGGIPTGTAQLLLDGSTWNPALLLSAGALVFPPTTIPLGAHTVSVRYAGDSVYAVSVSSPISYTVRGFTVGASPGSFSFTAGSSTQNSATLTYTSAGGFAGTINQACTFTHNGTGAALFAPSCSFTTPTVTLAAGGSVTSTMTIQSTAQPAVASAPAPRLPGLRGTVAAGVLTALLLPWIPRRRLGSLALLSAALCILAGLSACGSGTSSAVAGSAVPVATGSYTLTISSDSNGVSSSPALTIPVTIN